MKMQLDKKGLSWLTKLRDRPHGDGGFTLMEMVIAISIILILVVGGTLGYKGYTDNARDAAVETAAQQVYTAGQAEQHMPGTTDLDKVAADYNKSSSGITTAIAETENGICASAVFDSHPEHTAERGDCADAEAPAPGDDNNGDENTGDESDTGEDTGEEETEGPTPVDGGVMKIQWDSRQSKAVHLPISGSNVMVDWGDGTVDNRTEHAYKEDDEYLITITGTFSSWGNDRENLYGLTEVLEWKDTETVNLKNAFRGSGIRHIEEIPDGVRNTEGMFMGVESFQQDISDWDMSNVRSMRLMFQNSTFNQDISDWETSKVEDMTGMFQGARSFNQDISDWDTSSVEGMQAMFNQADAFDNGGEPLDWKDTSNVEDMRNMFRGADEFNQPIGDWDTSSVENMSNMFGPSQEPDRRFNQPIGDWDTSSVKDMSHMFAGANNFDHDISDWDTSSVESMQAMFWGARSFDNGGMPLDWEDTSNVKDMSRMFSGAFVFNQNVDTWIVSDDTDVGNMFRTANSFTNGVHPFKDWMIRGGAGD